MSGLTRQMVEELQKQAIEAGDDYHDRLCSLLLCRTNKTEDREFSSGRHDPAVLAAGQYLARKLGCRLTESL